MHDIPSDELLSAYYDGEVTAAERERVERWLESSPGVSAPLDVFGALSDLIRELPRDKAPPELTVAIRARIERETLLPRTDAAENGRAPVAASAVPASTSQNIPARKSRGWLVAAGSLLASVAAVAVMVRLLPDGSPSGDLAAKSGVPVAATAPQPPDEALGTAVGAVPTAVLAANEAADPASGLTGGRRGSSTREAPPPSEAAERDSQFKSDRAVADRKRAPASEPALAMKGDNALGEKQLKERETALRDARSDAAPVNRKATQEADKPRGSFPAPNAAIATSGPAAPGTIAPGTIAPGTVSPTAKPRSVPSGATLSGAPTLSPPAMTRAPAPVAAAPGDHPAPVAPPVDAEANALASNEIRESASNGFIGRAFGGASGVEANGRNGVQIGEVLAYCDTERMAIVRFRVLDVHKAVDTLQLLLAKEDVNDVTGVDFDSDGLQKETLKQNNGEPGGAGVSRSNAGVAGKSGGLGAEGPASLAAEARRADTKRDAEKGAASAAPAGALFIYVQAPERNLAAALEGLDSQVVDVRLDRPVAIPQSDEFALRQTDRAENRALRAGRPSDPVVEQPADGKPADKKSADKRPAVEKTPAEPAPAKPTNAPAKPKVADASEVKPQPPEPAQTAKRGDSKPGLESADGGDKPFSDSLPQPRGSQEPFDEEQVARFVYGVAVEVNRRMLQDKLDQEQSGQRRLEREEEVAVAEVPLAIEAQGAGNPPASIAPSGQPAKATETFANRLAANEPAAGSVAPDRQASATEYDKASAPRLQSYQRLIEVPLDGSQPVAEAYRARTRRSAGDAQEHDESGSKKFEQKTAASPARNASAPAGSTSGEFKDEAGGGARPKADGLAKDVRRGKSDADGRNAADGDQSRTNHVRVLIVFEQQPAEAAARPAASPANAPAPARP